MKNLKKVITLILALTMIFCLFSGFTYAPLASRAGIMIDQQPPSRTVNLNSNLLLGFSTVSRNDGIEGFTVEYKWYQCDDVNKTNSTLVFTEKKPITSKFNKIITVEKTHYFYCVATDMVDNSSVTSQVAVITVVGSSDVLPTYNIPVSVYSNTGSILEVKCYEGQALELPNAPNGDGYEFIGWQINNADVSSPVTITSSLVNADGSVVIQAKYKDYSPVKVTYFVEKSGFLGIKSWVELTSRTSKTGLKVPDVSSVVGESFDYYSLDKDGKKLVLTDYVLKDDLNIYIHQKAVADKFKVEYFTLSNYGVNVSTSGYSYRLNRTNYLSPNTAIDIKYAPNLENKDIVTSDVIKTYAFDYWSFDEAGKDMVSSDFVIDKDVKIYAQYVGVEDGIVKPSNENGGIWGFFNTVNDKILKPMNSWWGIGNAWDYVITIAVFLVGISFGIKLIVFGIKALIGFAFR